MNYTKLSCVLAVVGSVGFAGCSTPKGYEKAFSQSTALAGNTHSFAASIDQTFRTIKVTLVQRGFTIEQADAQSGLIRGARSLEDSKNPKLAYLITTTVDVSGTPSGDATVVTLSASQQTVLHKDSNKYYKLLGLVPIPTGKDYQTVVRREGNIGSAQFYKDFFEAVDQNLKQTTSATTPLAEMRVAVATPYTQAQAPSTLSGGAAAGQVRASAGLVPDAPARPPASHGPAAAASSAAATSAPAATAARPGEDEQPPSLLTAPNPFAQPAAADKPQ